jgi:hypothetical protein
MLLSLQLLLLPILRHFTFFKAQNLCSFLEGVRTTRLSGHKAENLRKSVKSSYVLSCSKPLQGHYWTLEALVSCGDH